VLQEIVVFRDGPFSRGAVEPRSRLPQRAIKKCAAQLPAKMSAISLVEPLRRATCYLPPRPQWSVWLKVAKNQRRSTVADMEAADWVADRVSERIETGIGIDASAAGNV
jgi:hypothetical protein